MIIYEINETGEYIKVPTVELTVYDSVEYLRHAEFETRKAHLDENQIPYTRKKIKATAAEKEIDGWPSEKTLEKRLTSGDYKPIKSYEYTATGQEEPYNMEAVHAARQEIRDMINKIHSVTHKGEENG